VTSPAAAASGRAWAGSSRQWPHGTVFLMASRGEKYLLSWKFISKATSISMLVLLTSRATSKKLGGWWGKISVTMAVFRILRCAFLRMILIKMTYTNSTTYLMWVLVFFSKGHENAGSMELSFRTERIHLVRRNFSSTLQVY